jgi:3-deoxy-manno-octulosonate cytidylyltransferase (CMP-KDO synthetase)
MSKRIGIIIPSRLGSTRLSRKPLIDLNGKTMIQRTWERCALAFPVKEIWIATDDDQIATHVSSFGANVLMTSRHCLTGTDRVAEANSVLGYDIVINVQGDEPLIDPQDIIKVVKASDDDNQHSVINCYAEITSADEFYSLSIPKVVTSLDGSLLYMSRAPIPHGKYAQFKFGFKQICIYSFPHEYLNKFYHNSIKTPFEEVEDIEILRFLELGIPVKMLQVPGRSIAVDTREDVEKVRKYLLNNS